MRAALIALGAGLALVAVLVAGELLAGFEFSDRFSSLRGGRGGAKAAFLVLGELGYAVKRLHQPPALAGLRGTLFVLLDAEAGRALPGEDGRDLLEWVAEGNALVVAHEAELDLLEALDLETAWSGELDPASRSVLRVGQGDPLPLAPAVRFASFRRPGRYRGGHGRYAVLLNGVGGPAAVVVPHGRGRVALVSDPWPLSNEGLAEPGNLELLLALASLGARAGPDVAWDELHHGFVAERSLVGWMRRRGLGPALLQGTGALLLAVVALRGRRRRAPREAEPPGPGTRDFLDAMARIYATSGFAGDAARALADDLERAADRVAGETHSGRRARPALPAALLAEVRQHAARGRTERRWRAGELVRYHNAALALERRLAAATGGDGVGGPGGGRGRPAGR